MKTFYTIFVTVLALLLGMYVWQNVIFQKDVIEKESSAWETYISDEGFSFSYPHGYSISETKDGNDVMVFIVEADENGDPVPNVIPSLQINVSPNSISFALWEGRPWEGFPKIVETFESE